MEIISTVAGLREAVAKAKAEGLTVGLVPTMGALHAGHISLIERARKECGFVVVSVFVNPTQFNNQNDLLTYPKTDRYYSGIKSWRKQKTVLDSTSRGLVSF